MSSGTPWWAPILAVAVTFAGTFANEERRRRHERVKQWAPVKKDAYVGCWNAGAVLLKAPVWPDNPAGEQAEVTTMTQEVERYAREVSFVGPVPVSQAGWEVAEAADAFARTVGEIRRTTLRGVGGAVAQTAQDDLARAQDRLTAAVADFSRLARADLRISDARPRGWWSRGPR